MLTREARVARAADLFAYACHDLDDAYSLGALRPADLPQRVTSVLGATPPRGSSEPRRADGRESLREGELSLLPMPSLPCKSSALFFTSASMKPLALPDRHHSCECSSSRFGRLRSPTSVVSSVRFLLEMGSEGPASEDLGRRFIDAIASMTDRQVLTLGRTLRLPRKARSMPNIAAAPSTH